MKSLFERLRLGRLATTFTILATLSAGILIGSVAAHGVRGQETKVDSSDANPLRVPNAKVLSNTFSQIAKEVGPAVVNINTEQLPKVSSSRRKNPHARTPEPDDQQQQPGDDDDDDQDGGQGGQNAPPGFQDFFNRFLADRTRAVTTAAAFANRSDRALSSTPRATSSPTTTSSIRPTRFS